MDDPKIGATYRDWQAIADRRLELLKTAPFPPDNIYDSDIDTWFEEYEGWLDKVQKELSDDLLR